MVLECVGFENVFEKMPFVYAIFVMILVRKNVYKDVCLLKMFSMFVRCF